MTWPRWRRPLPRSAISPSSRRLRETGAALRDWLLTGKDPVAASNKALRSLKAAVTKLDTLPLLANWWRTHEPEIDALTNPDRQALRQHCAQRKAAIIAAMTRPADTPKGNGQDGAPFGLEAIVGVPH